MSYFKQLLEVHSSKTLNVGYAERRAQEMANGDMEDYSLEEEVTLAMEEVNENEKDMKQLVQLAQFLFERSQDLQSKTDQQSNQIQMLLTEQTKMVEAATANQSLASTQKQRLEQLESINCDLER